MNMDLILRKHACEIYTSVFRYKRIHQVNLDVLWREITNWEQMGIIHRSFNSDYYKLEEKMRNVSLIIKKLDIFGPTNY